jgi:Flp pilus assembly protein TadD
MRNTTMNTRQMLRVLALLSLVTGSVAASAGSAENPLDRECEYGVTMALAGEDAKAKDAFTSMLSAAPGDARALNNLGNLHLMRGDFDVARAFYDQALAADKEDPGIRLNRAILLMLEGDEAEARREVAAARAQAGGEAEAAALLGLESTPDDGKASDASAKAKPGVSKDEIAGWLAEAMEQVPDSSATPDSTRAAGASGATRESGTLRSGGSRGSAAGVPDAKSVLYWKQ